jgi:hypothetical protein
MAEVIDYVTGQFASMYDSSLAMSVLVFAVVLAVASLFIWQFYKSTAKRNLIELNLRKYNWSDHPLTSKFFAIILYFLEYIIIMPVIIILWFAALSIVLLLIASERSINEVLLIAASMVGAIRILAYYNSEISKDLAKLFPFIALSTFLLYQGAFDYTNLFVHFSELPVILNSVFSFVLVVVAIEIVLRFIFTIIDFWQSEQEDEV